MTSIPSFEHMQPYCKYGTIGVLSGHTEQIDLYLARKLVYYHRDNQIRNHTAFDSSPKLLDFQCSSC